MIRVVDVTLTGISPLLMHRYPTEPVEAIEKMTAKEQAEIGAYRDPDTHGLYIPAVNVRRSLVAAAAFSKGKGRASLQKIAAACIQATPMRLALGVEDYVIDSQRVVIPSTRGAVLRHRPRLDQWAISFRLEFDSTLLSDIEVRRIVDDAGSRVGLLDFRPECKGPYGRFMVTKWEAG